MCIVMRRIYVHQGSLSAFETGLLRTGLLSLAVAAVTALFVWDARGVPRALGLAGLAALGLCAASRAIRLYRAGVEASLPAAVGRTPVRIRPARGFLAGAVVVAVVLPLAATGALLVFVDWVWLLVAGVALIGAAAAVTRAGGDRVVLVTGSETADALLQRLCIRADMPFRPVVVEYDALANAWTAGGRIHVTDTLLERLDDRELEGVLAHELAHLARRDAAVMEICSAPSRVLLGFAALVAPRLWAFVRACVGTGAPFGIPAGGVILAALCVPPAFVFGWISRLSMLGLSRSRELAADAVAATLTGSPSALASALLKLDGQRRWPLRDLREAEMLCIMGGGRARWLATHPPTALRVKRLEALEARIQTGRR
jgi:heat shock protein HtpX